MAEEKHYNTPFDEVSREDMSAMSTLLREVRGLSPISTPPVLVPISFDDEY